MSPKLNQIAKVDGDESFGYMQSTSHLYTQSEFEMQETSPKSSQVLKNSKNPLINNLIVQMPSKETSFKEKRQQSVDRGSIFENLDCSYLIGILRHQAAKNELDQISLSEFSVCLQIITKSKSGENQEVNQFYKNL